MIPHHTIYGHDQMRLDSDKTHHHPHQNRFSHAYTGTSLSTDGGCNLNQNIGYVNIIGNR